MAPLAGVMGAVVSEPMVGVLMPLEPIGALLAGMEPLALEVSADGVEGELVGAGVTVVLLVSSFLLQAPRASRAANAADVTAMVLRVDVNMRFP